MIIKGILDPQDAKDAVSFGADGIVVSNHGGRQLDGVLSTAKALPPLAKRSATTLLYWWTQGFVPAWTWYGCWRWVRKEC